MRAFKLAGQPYFVGLQVAICGQGLEKDRLGAQCNFCDTDFLGTNGENGGKFETASKLARHANKFWPDETTKKFIVLTGGEPMLQVDSS